MNHDEGYYSPKLIGKPYTQRQFEELRQLPRITPGLKHPNSVLQNRKLRRNNSPCSARELKTLVQGILNTRDTLLKVVLKVLEAARQIR